MSRYYGRSYNDRGGMFYAVPLVIAVVLCIVAITRPIDKVSDIRTIKGTVTEKAIKRNGNKDKYLVFIEDESGEIVSLEITDSLLYGRFDSSDVYAGIEVGKKYSFEVAGSRSPLLSWYPNIYSYEIIE